MSKTDFEISIPLDIPEEELEDPEIIGELEEASKDPKKLPAYPGPGITETNRIMMDTIRICLAEGKTDIGIIEELSLDPKHYYRLKRQLYQLEMDDLQSKSPEEHYIDYRLKQEQTIKDLESMSEDFRNSNNHNALIGAIRLKSEILARVWQTGRDIGIIKATPDRDREIAGALVSQLDRKAIRERVVTEVRSLYNLISKFGDRDILEVPRTPGVRGSGKPKIKIKRKKH